nr:serine/threonine protein kinase [Streptococcus thermophilus]
MTAAEYPLNSAEYNKFVVELAGLGYEVEGMIGRGGMGTVFRARQRHLDRTVAVKAMSRELIADPTARRRFDAEMRTMAALKHPAIVRVEYGAITASGIPFFVMEFIEGQSLDKVLASRRGRGFGVAATVDKLAPIARALDFLHSERKPVVHRDVKPANIMMSPDGAVLTDFGISYIADDTRLTQEGTIIGTDAYLAPELFAAGALRNGSAPQPTPASDNYAFALIALEMISGVSLRSTMSGQAWRGPRDLGALRDVPAADVFARALSNDPGQRYDSATEFMRALAKSGGRGATKTMPTAADRAVYAPPKRKNRVARAVAALALVLVVGGAGTGVWFQTQRSWSGADRVLVDSFPGLLPSHNNARGWRGTECASAQPDEGQQAKIVCRGDDLVYVIADFGTSENRERFTPSDDMGSFEAGSCRMRTGSLTGSDGTFVVVPSAPRDFAAVVLNGADADDARFHIPICR